MGHFFRHPGDLALLMGWEWRIFVPSACPADGSVPLDGCREDIYFPADAAAGLKLRNGVGSLEVKLQIDKREVSTAAGHSENWQKTLHSRCVAGGVLDVAACASAIGRQPHELFPPDGKPLPVRVFCRKKRKHTAHGEETKCVFLAFVGTRDVPSLVECYKSVSVELHSDAAIAKIVRRLHIPKDAIVSGYPGIVADVARRACQIDAARNFPATLNMPETAAAAAATFVDSSMPVPLSVVF